MNENASLSLGSMVMNFMWSSLVACKILQHWPLGYAHLGYHSKHCSYDYICNQSTLDILTHNVVNAI